jgi:hypothetical protein
MAFQADRPRYYFEDFLTAAWFHVHERMEFEKQDFFDQLSNFEMRFAGEGFTLKLDVQGRWYIAEESLGLVEEIKAKYPQKIWPEEEGVADDEKAH